MPDGRLLLIGGMGEDGPLSSVQIKDARSGSVTPLVNRLRRARSWHTATLLPDGKVLITGGVNPAGQVEESVELFDVETQTFETLRSTGLAARVYHTATLLTDGRVLIAGGLSDKGKPMGRAEVWDSRTGKAKRLPRKLNTARHGHTATLLADGSVLIWGGTDERGAVIDGGEVFTTATGDKKTSGSERFIRSVETPEQSEAAAPEIAASLPEDGASSVAVDSRIALRFNKPLRVETVNTESVILAGPYGAAPVKVIPAEGGRLAFITPTTELLPGFTYTLTISEATDTAGNSLGHHSITFTTASAHLSESISDGEEWIPGANGLEGDWRSGRGDSPWRSLPSHQAPPGVTALSGQVLKLNGKPLANVTLQIGEHSTRTDGTGRFLLAPIPSGRQELIIHGHTASSPGKTYGMFEVGVEIKEGRTNALGYTIWMLLIDTQNATPLLAPNPREVFAATKRVRGLGVRIPARTILRDSHGNVLKSLTITPIPVDRPPFPLPAGVEVPMFFTLQTHGAVVESLDGGPGAGVQIIFPNIKGLRPGASVDLWSHSAKRGWYTYGQGVVTTDARSIVPRSGTILPRIDCPHAIGLPGDAPEIAPPYRGKRGGDPVDLATGLFVLNETDLLLPDTIPIAITRTYRQLDNKSRAFGIGMSLGYDIYLVGDRDTYSYAELVMPDGARIRYERISPGTSEAGAVMEHTATPSEFYKSTLSWNSTYSGWDLSLIDGTKYRLEAFYPWVVLREIEDRNGNKLKIARDINSRRITRITSPNGRWVEFTYTTGDRITQVRDNIGRVVNYTYDGGGRLWKVTNPPGQVTEYSYDGSHRMLTIKDARGIVYLTNQYDANGRVSQQTQADSSTYQFAYTLDSNGKVIQTDLTDPRGNVNRVTFNGKGYPLTDTYAAGTALAQTLTYTRQSGTNLPLSITDQLGRRTDFTYDGFGNITSITHLAGTSEAVTTTYTYTAAFNQLATITDPLNHTTTFAYDSKGNLTSVTNALGHQTVFTYDGAGQVLTAKDALNNTTQFSYSRGDLVGITDPLGHSLSQFIDGAGRLISVTDAMGRTSRFEYDALNRPTQAIDPLGGTTSFTYDPNGNLLSVVDARNNSISYTYDNMDRVVTRRDPLLRDVLLEYNAGGLLKKVTDRKSQVTQFSYDALDRLTQVSYADGSTISYTYDAGNRVTQISDSVSGNISYTYDNLDRVTSETTPQGSVSYSYDAAGRLTGMSVSGQGAISYSYDGANRLTAITQGSASVTFSYDNAGRVTTQTLANGVVTEYKYDAGSRLTSIIYKKNGVVIGDLTYEYDAVGRRVKTGGSFARTLLSQSETTASYNAANHQTGFGSQTLTYDHNGSLTSDGANTYTWNARNQLASISGPGLVAAIHQRGPDRAGGWD